MTATPTWFGPAERPLFGWVHAPESGLATGAVVLCPPLAREHTAAHETYLLLAEALAAAGLGVVRFDYDGTGDSAGEESDPRRMAAWRASIGHAAALARACGAPSVSLVGMRVGALLALAAAPDAGPLDALVLWDPCASGRAFVRQQASLQRLRLEGGEGAGGTELPGLVLSEATVGELDELAPTPPGDGVRRVLVLERPGRRPGTALRSALQGVAVTEAEAEGQDALLDVEPLWQTNPVSTIGRVAAWLAAEPGGPPHPFDLTSPAPAATIMTAGGPVTERLVTLGAHGLFGVETSTGPADSVPVALLLPTGNDWHAGSGRLWVELARRWAHMGLRCVRFDESGLGDSPARPGRPRLAVRAPEAFDDVAEAVAAVTGGASAEVILVGLCSGAYQALEAALLDPPLAVAAVNPVVHFEPPELAEGGLDPRRRLCRPATGAVHTYRRVLPAPVRRWLRGPLWRLVQKRQLRRTPKGWLAELAEAGVRILAVGGVDEMRPVHEAARAAGAELPEGIILETLPGLDHGLLVAADRRRVTDLLSTFVADVVGSRRAPTSEVSAAPR